VKKCERVRSCPLSRHSSGGMEEQHKNDSRDRRCLGQDSNRGPPEYELERYRQSQLIGKCKEDLNRLNDYQFLKEDSVS
jgi:hypothetical protein